MRIHPVFHKKLLEPAPPNAKLAEDIELEDDEYKVEEIRDLRKFRVQEYYQENLKGSGRSPRKEKSNQKKDCKRQPVTSLD
ncbi:hypothetical protein TW65_01659 [Stemphylium lycopersici]|nr:hypothetical protein TW65_01659 [Stemphylium lycopersici]